jgi:hypothetical protein
MIASRDASIRAVIEKKSIFGKFKKLEFFRNEIHFFI